MKELGFNYAQGALRDGFQANTPIGRFWRLYLRNVAGFLPHQTDKATFGNTWRVVLAENEDALRRHRLDDDRRGRRRATGESAVTVARYTGGAVIASVFGTRPGRMPARTWPTRCAKQTGWELIFTVGFVARDASRPCSSCSPIIAETLAKAGLRKRDAPGSSCSSKRACPAWQFEQYIGGWTNLVPGRPSLTGLVQGRAVPPVFAESEDPERIVPIVCRAEDLMVAVSGDPLRTNAYCLRAQRHPGLPDHEADPPPGGVAAADHGSAGPLVILAKLTNRLVLVRFHLGR